MNKITPEHWELIQKAADGIVSGNLTENPKIDTILITLGIVIPAETPAQTLKYICELALTKRDKHEQITRILEKI